MGPHCIGHVPPHLFRGTHTHTPPASPLELPTNRLIAILRSIPRVAETSCNITLRTAQISPPLSSVPAPPAARHRPCRHAATARTPTMRPPYGRQPRCSTDRRPLHLPQCAEPASFAPGAAGTTLGAPRFPGDRWGARSKLHLRREVVRGGCGAPREPRREAGDELHPSQRRPRPRRGGGGPHP